MKKFVLSLLPFLMASSAYSQGHFLQVDDGSGHYSLIKGQITNALDNFTLPTGGGTILTSGSIPTFAWVLGGNTGVGASNQLGTLDNTAINFVTGSGGPNTRMSISSTGVVAIGASGQFSVNNTGNITKINNVAYSFPGAQGAANQVLSNDGSGNLSWINSSATITTTTNSSYTGGGSLSSNPTNDLLLNASSTYFRLNAVSALDLTGLNAIGVVDGRVIILVNVGTNTITLKHASASSIANNRFDFPGASDVILGAKGTATLIYDASDTRWKLVSTN